MTPDRSVNADALPVRRRCTLCNHGCERRNDSLDLHVALSAYARIVGASGTKMINQGVHHGRRR